MFRSTCDHLQGYYNPCHQYTLDTCEVEYEQHIKVTFYLYHEGTTRHNCIPSYWITTLIFPPTAALAKTKTIFSDSMQGKLLM
jgi:hypothetical protein